MVKQTEGVFFVRIARYCIRENKIEFFLKDFGIFIVIRNKKNLNYDTQIKIRGIPVILKEIKSQNT